MPWGMNPGFKTNSSQREEGQAFSFSGGKTEVASALDCETGPACMPWRVNPGFKTNSSLWEEGQAVTDNPPGQPPTRSTDNPSGRPPAATDNPQSQPPAKDRHAIAPPFKTSVLYLSLIHI